MQHIAKYFDFLGEKEGRFHSPELSSANSAAHLSLHHVRSNHAGFLLQKLLFNRSESGTNQSVVRLVHSMQQETNRNALFIYTTFTRGLHTENKMKLTRWKISWLNVETIQFDSDNLQTISSFSSITFRDNACASKCYATFWKLFAKRKNTSVDSCWFWPCSTGNSPGIYFLAHCLLAGSRARSDLPEVNQSLIYAHFIYSQTRAIKWDRPVSFTVHGGDNLSPLLDRW